MAQLVQIQQCRATIHVNPLVATTIKNRYLAVTRIGKGK